MKSVGHCYLEISCLQGFQSSELWWRQMTFDLHKKQYAFPSQHDKPIHQIWRVSIIAILRYHVYKPVLSFSQFNPRWPQITFDCYQKRQVTSSWHDKSVYQIWSVLHSYLEISCLQGFQILTSGDLKWPLTSTKNNRLLSLYEGYPQTKFELHWSFLSWDIVCTRFSDSDPPRPPTQTQIRLNQKKTKKKVFQFWIANDVFVNFEKNG